MTEKFISFPQTDLDGNNLPNALTNALLHATPSLTGLANGVGRRAFVLQNPSPLFIPSAGAPELLLNNSFADGSVGSRVWEATTPASAVWSISGGELRIQNRGDTFADGIFQTVSVLPSRAYDVSVTVNSVAVGGVRIKLEDFDIPGLTPLTTPGTYTAIWTNSSWTTRRFIVSTSQPTADVRVGEVSFKLRPL